MTDEDKRVVTLGNKLSIAATIVGFICTIVVVTLAFAAIDTRVTLAESKIGRLEELQREGTRSSREDRDILVELRTDVKQMKAVLQRLEGAQQH